MFLFLVYFFNIIKVDIYSEIPIFYMFSSPY